MIALLFSLKILLWFLVILTGLVITFWIVVAVILISGLTAGFFEAAHRVAKAKRNE